MRRAASSGAVEGFDRAEWQQLDAALAELAGANAARIDWAALPAWRPGCGSLSVDPRYADRLRAEAENSPLRARKIEIAPQDDEFEFMFDQGFTDGLPVVPPTPERVIRMLSGTRRDPQQVVALVPPNMGEATVEKDRDQCGARRMSSRLSARRHCRTRSGVHRCVQHPWRDGDDDGRKSRARRQRPDPRSASA